MTNNYTCIDDIMSDVEGYIKKYLRHIFVSEIKRNESNRKIIEEKVLLNVKVISLTTELGISLREFSKITNLASAVFCYIKNKRYNCVSKNKYFTIIERLEAFKKDLSIYNFNECVNLHFIYRQEEKEMFVVPKEKILRATIKEIYELIKDMKLMRSELRCMNRGHEGAYSLIVARVRKGLTLRRIFDLLLYLRKLKASGFKSKRTITFEEKSKLYKNIKNKLEEANLKLNDLIKYDICNRHDAFAIKEEQDRQFSVNRLTSISDTVDDLSEAMTLI